jgi:hypothetical protein
MNTSPVDPKVAAAREFLCGQIKKEPNKWKDLAQRVWDHLEMRMQQIEFNMKQDQGHIGTQYAVHCLNQELQKNIDELVLASNEAARPYLQTKIKIFQLTKWLRKIAQTGSMISAEEKKIKKIYRAEIDKISSSLPKDFPLSQFKETWDHEKALAELESIDTTSNDRATRKKLALEKALDVTHCLTLSRRNNGDYFRILKEMGVDIYIIREAALNTVGKGELEKFTIPLFEELCMYIKSEIESRSSLEKLEKLKREKSRLLQVTAPTSTVSAAAAANPGLVPATAVDNTGRY